MTAPRARTVDVLSGGRAVPVRFPSKAPKGDKRYGYNFRPLIGSQAQIQSAAWRSIEGDLVFNDVQFSAQGSSARVSSGNQDQTYTVACKITTDQNETIEVMVPLHVRRERL